MAGFGVEPSVLFWPQLENAPNPGFRVPVFPKLLEPNDEGLDAAWPNNPAVPFPEAGPLSEEVPPLPPNESPPKVASCASAPIEISLVNSGAFVSV
jgi:hypothetical protein